MDQTVVNQSGEKRSNRTLRPTEQPELRDLAASGWWRAWKLFTRSMQRRCPLCGCPGLFEKWFNMKQHCPDCGYKFAREAAYFYGSYPVNLILAEIIPMGVLIFLLVSTSLSVFALEAITIPLAVGLPLLFYPFSCMLWMAVNLLITPVDQQ